MAMLAGTLPFTPASHRARLTVLAALAATAMAALLALPAVAGAAWSAPDDLSLAGTVGFNSQVAVDDGGNAVVVWQRFDGANWRVQARARDAGGAVSAVQTLSDAGQHATQPQVAMDAAGNAVVAWQRFDGSNLRAQVRARTAGGVVSPIQTLSAAGQSVFAPQVGMDG